jgi:two-component system chemotaxis sensor kinase CheA
MPDEMDEIIQEFLAESIEGLDRFDQDIVALEADPTSADHLSSAFRVFHTVKGTSGFLGFDTLEKLTHAAENLLGKLRDGELRLNTARTNVLLDVADTIRSMLAVIEQTGHDGGRDVSSLVSRIEALQTTTDADVRARTAGQPKEAAAFPGEPSARGGVTPPDEPSASSGAPTATVLAAPARSDAPVGPGGPVGPTLAPSVPPGHRDDGAPGSARSDGQTSPQSPEAADSPPDGDRTPPGGATQVAERSVRVDVEILDSLMRQVGELVLARNEVASYLEALEGIGLAQPVQRLSLIVSELQEGVMKTRMQPLTQLFSKLPRMVRDLGAQFGKDVSVVVSGSETELDRSVMEAIRDPFTHLVRNAIDHGLETREERRAAGKNPTGTLAVRAYHEGGHVIMEVSDDGRGIDPQRVAAKAQQLGMATAEQLAGMSHRELLDLIFAPGFSTAEKVTNISGRGVGMDVVRANIASIGGSVDVSSRPGEGTTFRIKIPLTLAIVPALLVACRSQRYAIPQPNLVEMLHIGTQASPAVVETIDQAEVMRLRGQLLPLVRLDDIFGFPPRPESREGPATVAVLQAEELKFGLVVDDVYATQEIVVKPLGEIVKSIEPFAGATILGDGTVSLIIDVVGLASTAGLRETTARLSAAGHDLGKAEEEAPKTAFLILRVGENRTIAVPIDQVARLESIPPSSVEKSGEIDVVQYRGGLMRLVRLHEVLGILGHSAPPDAPLKVVVHESEHGPIGFVVADLVDVLEDVVDLTDVDSGYGLAGAVVLHGRVTDVLDLDTAILWMQREGFFSEAR